MAWISFRTDAFRVDRGADFGAGGAGAAGLRAGPGETSGVPPVQPAKAANAPATPEEAARRLTLPRGFKAVLCAAEPDVVQPIAMTLDPRGRLWVVENSSYPIWLGGPHGGDRILIFEDDDGDGRFDRRTVFYDKGTNFTGIELGYGGVWVCATPNLLFFPDRDGDDRPDGPPVVKLDGWNVNAQHNLFNALKWGPDGWLWGCHGILSTANVGKPGTPKDQRVPMNCGVWRYHPTREVFEVVAHGTTNPWGLDFDDFGKAFITNCVIAHLFRVIPGSHFERMYGSDFNPHLYELMAACADHLHWAGGRWQDAREGNRLHDTLGGGHAHVGGMIYLADNWPEKYRNSMFTVNIHGHRVNNDRLDRIDDGYDVVGRHNPDFLLSSDSWFRGLELKYGPDGGVYLTDWSDVGECHENDADNAHRENGRIFKITYGDVKPAKVDLARESDEELARLQLHANEWFVRTAPAAPGAGRDGQGPRRGASRPARDARHGSRAAAPAPGDLGAACHRRAGREGAAGAAGRPQPAGPRLGRPAAGSRRPAVGHGDRSPRGDGWRERVARRSAGRAEHAGAALAGLGHATHPRGAALAGRGGPGDGPCAGHDAQSYVADLVRSGALVGATATMPPPCWPDARIRCSAGSSRGGWSPPTSSRAWRRCCRCSGRGRGPIHRSTARCSMVPSRRSRAARRGCRRIGRMSPDGWPIGGIPRSAPRRPRWGSFSAMRRPRRACDRSSRIDPACRRPPLRLAKPGRSPHRRVVAGAVPAARRSRAARAGDPCPGGVQRTIDAAGLPEAIHRTLARRARRRDRHAGLAAGLGGGPAGCDPRRSDPPPRREHDDRAADPRLRRSQARGGAGGVLGPALRPTAQDKAPLIAKYKAILASDNLPPADPDRGRALFGRICTQCHKLFGQGGDVGPDLTGSDRANPDYILENVLDPSASVGKDYTLTTVATSDGRLVAGIVRERSAAALVIQTASERITLPREDVNAIKTSNASMMPEGQLDPLTPQEVRDLFAYLAATKPGRAN